MQLVIGRIAPPIPIRSMDWVAHWDDYDGAEDSNHPIGTGTSEKEAVQDLIYNMHGEETEAHRNALAKKYPCDDCGGTGLSAGWMDDPCDACGSTGTEIET